MKPRWFPGRYWTLQVLFRFQRQWASYKGRRTWMIDIERRHSTTSLGHWLHCDPCSGQLLSVGRLSGGLHITRDPSSLWFQIRTCQHIRKEFEKCVANINQWVFYCFIKRWVPRFRIHILHSFTLFPYGSIVIICLFLFWGFVLTFWGE